MTNYNKIEINDNTITGSQLKSNKIINLTSLHGSLLKVILSRIPDIADSSKLTFEHLNNRLVFSIDTREPIIRMSTKKLVTVVIDSDDKYADIKIKNLKRFIGYIMVTKIIISTKLDSSQSESPKQGRKIRVAHTGHTLDKFKTLNALDATSRNVSSVVNVVVVGTNDDRCGSISALVSYFKLLGCSIQYERVVSRYTESWLTTRRKNIDFDFVDNDHSTDVLPQNDPYWSYKAGYTDHLLSNMGIKQIVFNKKGKQNKHKWIEKVMSFISSVAKKAMNLIRPMITYVKSMFTTNDKSKVNAKVAFGFVTLAPVAANTCSSLYVATLSKNASKDIKKANKVIAKMQLNKLLSRVGVGGDKSILGMKMSDSFNAYLSSITSYNTSEAIINANNLATSSYNKRRGVMVAVMLLVVVIKLVLTNQPFLIATAIVTVVVDYFTSAFEDTKIFHALLLISSSGVMHTLIALLSLLAETLITDDKTLFVRELIYALLHIISGLTWI